MEHKAMTVVNNSPDSVYRNAESISIWTGRTSNPKISLATPKTLVDRISKMDRYLIDDLGSKRLIRNLTEHSERVFNKVYRKSTDPHAEEVLEVMDERLPYLFLSEICHKPKNGSLIEPFSVTSFLAYHDNPTNNEKENRKSKITNDRRHFRRNLEAHIGLHIFRDEEVQALVDLASGMLRNEGYPSENEKGFFSKYPGYLDTAEDVLRVLFNGKLSRKGFDYIRPAQYVDEFGFAQSKDGRDALFLNRYNRPDDQLTKIAARETSEMMNKLRRKETSLKNGHLFAEAQKRVIADIIKRDQL
jgi:hypothetical protein